MAKRGIVRHVEVWYLMFSGWKSGGTTYRSAASPRRRTMPTNGSISTVDTMFSYVCDAIAALEEDEIYSDNNPYNLCLSSGILGKLRGSPRLTLHQRRPRTCPDRRSLERWHRLLHTASAFQHRHRYTDRHTHQHFKFLNPIDYHATFAHPKYDEIGSYEGCINKRFHPSYTRIHANGTTDSVCKITGPTV